MIAVLVILSVKRSYHNASLNVEKLTLSKSATMLTTFDGRSFRPHDIWYLDSCCRNHMTGNLNLFSSLDNSVQTDVTLGNNICWVKYMLSVSFSIFKLAL